VLVEKYKYKKSYFEISLKFNFNEKGKTHVWFRRIAKSLKTHGKQTLAELALVRLSLT
jgi:hypothetical protein